MHKMFQALDGTIQKSTMKDFKAFLSMHKDILKWTMSSDYCIRDKNKSNDVMSFVLFPYILYLNQWQDIIRKLQPKDIKDTIEISDEFCKFTKSGLFFTFSFIFKKGRNCFDNWKNKENLQKMVDSYIDMIDLWMKRNSKNKDHYLELKKSLKKLKIDMRANSFNTSLLYRTVVTCFLSSYLYYLLISEVDVEKFSWMPDRGPMTNFAGGVYKTLCEIFFHCLCETELPEGRKHIAKQAKKCLPEDPNNDMFYDEIVRVPDYFSGIIADYDIKNNLVSGDKYLKGIEQILADNKFLSMILVEKEKISRVYFRSEISICTGF